MRVNIRVRHSKQLAETQFEGIKGSPQHAAMSMNRVWIDLNFKDRGNKLQGYQEHAKQLAAVTLHLRKNARNYFFIGKQSGVDDYSIRVYFLSKVDMDDFSVWAAAALPVKGD